MTTFVKRNVKYLTQMAQFENYSSFPGAFKKYFKTLIRLHKTFFQISFSRKFYNYIVTKKKRNIWLPSFQTHSLDNL